MAVRKKAPARKISVRNSRSLSAKVTRPSRSVTSTATSQPSSQSAQNAYLKNPRLWVGIGVVVLAALIYFYKGLFIAAMVNGQNYKRPYKIY